mgnify:CR=1 FL=1
MVNVRLLQLPVTIRGFVKENEDDWKEIRDLIIIYASMYHSIRNLKQEG